MFAVERLGSYIKGGIGKVSRPLQPFGGAVDIIVVEQPDGTFKSCPWYVRFGKSQGALKPVEKVISISVNDVDADFSMYLDSNGDAYFVREIDVQDGLADFYPSAYGDEKILSPRIRRMQKSKSCDYDVNRVELVSEFEAANGNMLARGSSHLAVFRLPFEDESQKVDVAVRAAASLERAEMAADLLEMRWSTNLKAGEKWNANPPQIPKPKWPVAGAVRKFGVEDAPNMKILSVNGCDDGKLDSSVYYEVNGASSDPSLKQSINKETDVEFPHSVGPGNPGEFCTLAETCVGVNLESGVSDTSYNVDGDRNAECEFLEVSASILEVSCLPGAGLKESKSVPNNIDFSMSRASEGNTIPQQVEHSAHAVESLTNLNDHLSAVNTASKGEMDTNHDQNPCTTVLLKQEADEKEDNVEHIAWCNERNETSDNVIESENAEEEQFSFSDLHDCKMGKVDLVGVSPPDDRKQCLPQDFPDNSEEIAGTILTAGEPHPAAADKFIQDNQIIICPSIKFESKQVSSPITIHKNYHDADKGFITPVTESLPSMHLVGNNLDKVGVAQPLSRSLDSNFEPMKIVSDDDHDYSESSVDSSPNSSEISEEIKSIISDPAIEVSLCRHLLYEGMGYEAAALVFDSRKLDKGSFCSLGPDIVKSDELAVRIGGLYFPWDEALPIASAIGSQGREDVLEAKGMIAVSQADKTGEGNPQKNMNSRNGNGSWKLWPFSFKRTNSVKSLDSKSAPGNAMGKDSNTRKYENKEKDGSRKEEVDAQKDVSAEKDRNTGKEGDANKDASEEKDGNAEKIEVTNIEARKFTKKIRAKIPTSEQLASLKLKKGKNVVTFSFTTTTLGKQQVHARIFLWKWDTRIVISDVDGTITKSDVLGHVMPLMGIDWSQSGVTHLFSAIEENGYQLLFLSARSILQASTTRQFLMSLKQEGKVLPEGPIVISPDGLFPSLYREVIRRAPHEFKISCLEDIKALFPRDHNPFYAGFGNRDTDELSYMKVGIPKGKIFTINPKGEVAINRRVDTKSYTSLHALVHNMFPPTPVIEQEDYNTWNFWRLPPPEL